MSDDIEGEGSETFAVAVEQEIDEQPIGENGTEEVAETEEETEAEVAEKPKGKSVQERIDEITAARREAERDAEYWRTKALGTQPEKQAEAPTEANDRPDPTQFEFGEADPAYIEALTDWKVDTRLAAAQEKQQADFAEQQLNQTYAQHIAAVKDELPDYDEKVTKAGQRGEWPCPREVAALIKSSPVGPRVAYHLATNPDDARAIAEMSPINRAAAFGLIAAQFANQPAKQPNIATSAPEPAPARTKGGQFAPSGALDDRLSMDEWVRRRNAQVKAR